MDLLASIHKQWVEKIFNGTKPFEFRTKLPKRFKPGDKMYLYETGKNGGRKMIVGHAVVGKSFSLRNEEGQYPMFGCYHFIDYFCENVLKDSGLAEKFRECKKYDLPEYRYGCLLHFALSESAMAQIKDGKYPKFDFRDLHCYDGVKDADMVMEKCDAWLTDIGFYDDVDESYWKYALPIVSICRYETPVPISEFLDREGNAITKAPQSYMYCWQKGEK